MQAILGKHFTFEASHQLPDAECYGKCSNLHGHRYELTVEMIGPIQSQGWVCDFAEIKAIVHRDIIAKLDHQHLNHFFPLPTAENIGTWIAQTLSNALAQSQYHLHKIKLYETATSYVEILANDLIELPKASQPETSTPKKAVAIFSGGMDSITLLCWLQRQGYRVWGVSFDYGQKHAKELAFAEYWGGKLCQEWQKIVLDFFPKIAQTSALTNSTLSMPYDHYTDANQKITVVPNRNMVMLSIATSWAENLGIQEVYFGPHSNDRAVYPDCRPEFVHAMSLATQLATYQHVIIQAPFAKMSKADIARLGHDLGVDFSKTWSCYEGRNLHCGKCATCQERKEAFAQAKIADPTIYE